MQNFKKPIKIGDYVKYLYSDTEGIVIDIKENEIGIWALIDTTNLYYKMESVEIVEGNIKKKQKSLKSNEAIMKIKEKTTLEEPIVSHITGGG
ncbi:MAG: DUF2098 domain-containing protein [Methanosarcinaceae archaeon]|nr:DUF2098 domain-containing protein [Methanosarcinaceae archaeon]NKQ37889.1 DUF2098 family protein [Methanosarcinales archaeon]